MVILQNCASGGTSDIQDLLSLVNNEGDIDISAKDLKGVTSVPDYAFYECKSLHSIEMPNTVTYIGEKAFYNCYNLIDIYYNGTKAEWNNLSKGSEWDYGADDYRVRCTDGYIYKERLAYRLNDDGQSYGVSGIGRVTGTDIVISSTYRGLPITSIRNGSLRDQNITSVVISNSVTNIGSQAFTNCANLTSVTMPNSITAIGNDAFCGCENLASITIPNSVTTIGDSAFYGCFALTSLTIPNSVTNFGKYVCEFCINATTITLPNGLTNIPEATFYGCRKLENITIPDGVITIDKQAFNECMKLESIIIPNGVTTIDYKTFASCTRLSSISLPVTLEGIGGNAFRFCNSLTSINYNGTMSQWRSVILGGNWDISTGNYTIHCTDGDIPKQQ